MTRRIWATVSIEVPDEDINDSETLMDAVHMDLVQCGMTIDDMGIEYKPPVLKQHCIDLKVYVWAVNEKAARAEVANKKWIVTDEFNIRGYKEEQK